MGDRKSAQPVEKLQLINFSPGVQAFEEARLRFIRLKHRPLFQHDVAAHRAAEDLVGALAEHHFAMPPMAGKTFDALGKVDGIPFNALPPVAALLQDYLP